ncbi:CAP-Gly domain-containing linker protein 1 [Argiope bruennichi]|uniref:CAP-Gly domain-containing linker protein 1 n=1 Tax=Argiope bruennichi TaxID=94029 RepID=A0A8T0EYC5_ARGBR|nr:CAP-Gly domain-containing linker protein 1 [Argiope bruennichi]
MDLENGYSEGMEGKVRCGSLRQKSKVPRACCSQRSEYPGEIVKTQGMNLHHGDEYKEWQKLVGERVCISGVKQGTLRYFGRTNFAQGYWCGVELDEPVGKNNGTVNGVVYFNCKPNHGIFAPVTKVSKLNDLSACNWQFDSREIMTSTQKQETRMRHSNWDYTLGLMNDVELTEKKYIKNSMSDPSFLQATMRTALPRSSESFPYVKRSYMEQHDSSLSFKNIRNFQEVTTRRSKTQPSSSSNTFVKNSSSFNVSKYGYNQKNQYLGSSGLYLDETSESTARHHSFRSNSSIQNSALTEECEQFLRTPTNSGEVSPMSSDTKRFNEMPLYDYSKMPDAFLSAFQPRDFSDFEDEGDAEDRMSVDYDESLGILTPSQMKDLTLGADFKTSLSDIRAMDFPSSESFDDINDLPEDEQVHDVSVFHVSESSATRNVEVSKPNNLGSYNSKTYSAASEDKVHLSTLHADHQKINNLEKDKYFEEKSLSNMDELSMKGNLHLIQSNSLIAPGVAFPEKHALTLEDQNKTDIDQNISTYHDDGVKSKICPVKNLVNEEMLKRNYDTDDSRDSLQTESENHATMKEKLTVSWEDCLSRSNDSMFPHTERPESVYTVGSNDTGFQEDGELEGMTTSLDSTDGNKRFSTTSRDSCIVADEVDVYKITESNSTSGYSTGLSDSCCNDRVEDDLSSKPLTDEEIQDSVGPCDSEDAFSFQEGNSLSKDPDMMTMESSEITTETVTALCNNDSASDALCETMVEDSTLTEIHELLLSPEENKSSNSIDAKEIATEPRKESTSEEVESPKSHEAKDSDVVSGSPSQSTPEKNPSHPKGKAETARSTTVANRTSRASRLCDDDSDKKKQVAKSPKKNVMSKIKAMIEATSCKAAPRTKNDTNESVSRRAVSAPKKSRWEAVTSKIAASLAEEKTKPKARRDIKSRVDTNLISTRQQNITCRSPKLDSSRLSNCEGSMSPISVSSRDRRPLTERNSTTNSQRETRVKLARDVKQRPKSPRPTSKACITSRSVSPESSSAASLNSHSKVPHWKGSTSTVASSAHPPHAKRPPSAASAKATVPSAKSTPRIVSKKPPVPKIRVSAPPSCRVRSPSPSSRASVKQLKADRVMHSNQFSRLILNDRAVSAISSACILCDNLSDRWAHDGFRMRDPVWSVCNAGLSRLRLEIKLDEPRALVTTRLEERVPGFPQHNFLMQAGAPGTRGSLGFRIWHPIATFNEIQINRKT